MVGLQSHPLQPWGSQTSCQAIPSPPLEKSLQYPPGAPKLHLLILLLTLHLPRTRPQMSGFFPLPILESQSPALKSPFLPDALSKVNSVVPHSSKCGAIERSPGTWPYAHPPVTAHPPCFAVSYPGLCFLLQAPCWAQTVPPWGWPGDSVSCSCCMCVALAAFQVSLYNTFEAGRKRWWCWLPQVCFPPSSPFPAVSP